MYLCIFCMAVWNRIRVYQIGFLRVIGLAFSLLLLGTPSFGEHIIGGMFTYSCLGYLNGDPASGVRVYRMTLRVYRDCQGGGSDFDSTGDPAPTATVTIYRDGVFAPFDTRALLPPTERIVNPDPGNPCLEVPTTICVEEGVYEFELELPVSTEAYHVVYQRCCRNATINNLVNPDDVGATFAVTITPEAQQVCNSAPDFQNLPPVVFCVNNPFAFDLGATDPEGDSLVYSLCSPWDGGGRNNSPITDPNGLAPDPDLPPPFNFVPFITPTYSATQPLGTNAQLDLDPASGLLAGLASQQGQFVIGLCVAEYRNGVLLSEVRREIQINAVLCDEALTAAVESDGLGPNGEFLIRSCGLQDVFIENRSERESLISAYRWEIELDTGTFIATTKDLTLTFPASGQFSGQLILNPSATATCRDTAQLQFDIFPALEASASVQFDSCIYEPIAFQSQVVAPGGGLQVNWDFGDGSFSDQSAPEHLYAQAGAYLVAFTAADQNGCTDTILLDIDFFPVPQAITLEVENGCVPLTISLPTAPNWLTDDYVIQWDFGNGEVLNTWPDQYTYLQSGIFDVQFSISGPTGCALQQDLPAVANVQVSPMADFSFSPNPPDFLDPTVNFSDRSTGALGWRWDFGGLGSSFQQNPTFTFPDTGAYAVFLEVVSENGCLDTATTIVSILAQNTYFLPNAFTPNGDLLNDVFVGKGILSGIKSFDLSIWNRWGEPIFSSSDPLTGWNGRRNNNGNLQPQGVYVYIVQFLDINGTMVRKKGEVMLLH